MAIPTPDIAQVDFVTNYTKAEAIAGQLHHSVALVGARTMVKIEDSQVGSAAVDAWVGHEVVSDERDIRGALSIVARTDHSNVVLAIALIVLARGRSVAVPTDFLTSVGA
ncbi:hypothetical protein ACSS7Z_13975 [Microbacterium sp. A82]|uniref:hypothetical protein n=1 Tax=unclassified Microbacterium TaxID=2609290 RepID=UPI003F3B0F87